MAELLDGRTHMADDTWHEIDADALAVVEARTSSSRTSRDELLNDAAHRILGVERFEGTA